MARIAPGRPSCARRRACSRAAPSREALIHLLIVERATVIRWQRGPAIPPCPTLVGELDLAAARGQVAAMLVAWPGKGGRGA